MTSKFHRISVAGVAMTAAAMWAAPYAPPLKN
jgi:hypothetical protein